MPPDLSRRSLDSVRDWPASHSSFSSDSDSSTPSSSPEFASSKRAKQVYSNVVYPLTPPHSSSSLDDDVCCGGIAPPSGATPKDITGISHSTPRDIPDHGQLQKPYIKGAENAFHNLATPPATPDGSPTSEAPTKFAAQAAAHDTAALDFLARLFPGSARVALSHAKSVRIASSELAVEVDESGVGYAFEGVVLDLPGCTRTLYIDGKGAENVKLRESIVALLDLADEHLECSALVIALERSSPALSSLLHSFMYVGATVVTRPAI
ncbi:ornithine decarboxylase antizyme-domain-containing protein [Phellopilus nigrolimitatus]|nr:ornithine decarboxylase antizyme-domain-containing protein [Phellopilus nigrolimitatus]